MSFQNKNSDNDQRCGEIFMTAGRNIVFLCTLCEKKYDGFGEYVAHLDDHFPLELDNIVDPIELIQLKQEHSLHSKEALESNVLDEAEITIPESDIFKTLQNSVDETSNNPRNSVKEEHQLPEESLTYRCTICTARCKDAMSLTKHIQKHMTERKHYCPKCAKSFYTLADVKKHMYLHYHEQRFLCTICGKICRTNSRLVDHMRRHTNEKDFQCSYCGKSFYNRRLLSQHIQIHSDERTHKCDLCGASFTFHKGLMNHMKLHENKRSYKCTLCTASFNQQAGLSSHLKAKHKH